MYTLQAAAFGRVKWKKRNKNRFALSLLAAALYNLLRQFRGVGQTYDRLLNEYYRSSFSSFLGEGRGKIHNSP